MAVAITYPSLLDLHTFSHYHTLLVPNQHATKPHGGYKTRQKLYLRTHGGTGVRVIF